MVEKAKRLVIVVSEDKFDKAMMSMMMANTAASMGMEVHVFHTFFGLNLLKKGKLPKLAGTMCLFTGVFVGEDEGGRDRELPGTTGDGLGPGREHIRMQHDDGPNEAPRRRTWSTGSRYWEQQDSWTSRRMATSRCSSARCDHAFDPFSSVQVTA